MLKIDNVILEGADRARKIRNFRRTKLMSVKPEKGSNTLYLESGLLKPGVFRKSQVKAEGSDCRE
jgi:hypothetical protein